MVFLDQTVTALRCQQILSENIIESKNMMGLDRFIFQQDNETPPTSTLLKRFFEENKIQLLPWPANSPDLNPIENIWGHISSELSKKNIKSLNDLKNEISNIWENLDISKLQKLVNSMPNLLREVIENNGQYTNY